MLTYKNTFFSLPFVITITAFSAYADSFCHDGNNFIDNSCHQIERLRDEKGYRKAEQQKKDDEKAVWDEKLRRNNNIIDMTIKIDEHDEKSKRKLIKTISDAYKPDVPDITISKTNDFNIAIKGGDKTNVNGSGNAIGNIGNGNTAHNEEVTDNTKEGDKETHNNVKAENVHGGVGMLKSSPKSEKNKLNKIKK